MTSPAVTPLLCLAAALATGCATAGAFVWVEASDPAGRHTDEFVIAPGDVLGVRVSGQEALSSRALVRADGKITLPMVNDQLAAGLTPTTLAQLLDAQYRTFIKTPVVTVLIEERHASRISVVGAVRAPGVFQLEPGLGVLQALALAGGLTPFAQRDRIFVVRREEDRPPVRFRFRYQSLIEADRRSASFDLRHADVVVVE